MYFAKRGFINNQSWRGLFENEKKNIIVPEFDFGTITLFMAVLCQRAEGVVKKNTPCTLVKIIMIINAEKAVYLVVLVTKLYRQHK